LRNFDGTPRIVGGKRLISDPAPFVNPTLASPVFSKTNYSSSERPTQFTDAVQRAEFFHPDLSLRSSGSTHTGHHPPR
jgi:hypothetical protein